LLIDRFGAPVWAKPMLGFVLDCGDAVELTEDESYDSDVGAGREW
jgi:hypothetical protein